jgi:hypothetical protein
MTISQELATRLESWHRTAILEHTNAQEFAHAFIASPDADGLEDGWAAIEAACRATYAELSAEPGARLMYAISAVPGHEAETAGAVPADNCERTDAVLGRYEVSAYVEADSAEEALDAAMRYYGLC